MWGTRKKAKDEMREKRLKKDYVREQAVEVMAGVLKRAQPWDVPPIDHAHRLLGVLREAGIEVKWGGREQRRALESKP